MPTLDTRNLTQDGRKTQGVTPVYRPLVNGEDLDISVSKIDMALAESSHDAVSISCTSSTITDAQTLVGKAISFFFGLSPHTELFNGYIETVREDQNSTGAGVLAFTMGILGATKEMQVGKPSYWRNSTIPQAVQSVAYRGWLGYHGHTHSLVWPMLAQTEETDWKLVSNFAKRLGWSIYNRYGVVMCYDPLRLITENGSYIDLVAKQYTSTGFEDFERALVEFQPTEESNVSYRQLGLKLAFFNNATVQTTTQRGEKYEIFRYLTDVVARSPEEADVYVNSPRFTTTSWPQQAMARVLGNANIYPGMCVNIYTSDTRFYKNRYNGRWLVRGVQHSGDRQTFQTMLALARPSSSVGVSMQPYEPFWNQSVTSQTRPSLILTDGQWLSSWADRTRNVP